MNKIDFAKDKIPFTQVANGVLQDPNLSASAKGVYAYLYSKPDGWDFNYIRISGEFKDSKNTILKYIHELEKNGLLTRSRQSDGRVKYHVIYPPIEPVTKDWSVGQKPLTKKASDQNSHRPNIGHISNKEGGVKKIIQSNKDSEPSSQEIALLLKSFELINPACKQMYGNKTQRKACSDLIETYGFQRIESIIKNTLPRTNILPYFPSIQTPVQLFQNFSKLEASISKHQNSKKEEVAKKSSNVAF